MPEDGQICSLKKQLFSQHTWSAVWAEMMLGQGRGNWAGALNANGEMTQTNQQTNRWMDGQTDRHDKLQNSMIQYSCVHVYNNFFPDYVFLAYLYARNITKEKVAKIT